MIFHYIFTICEICCKKKIDRQQRYVESWHLWWCYLDVIWFVSLNESSVFQAILNQCGPILIQAECVWISHNNQQTFGSSNDDVHSLKSFQKMLFLIGKKKQKQKKNVLRVDLSQSPIFHQCKRLTQSWQVSLVLGILRRFQRWYYWRNFVDRLVRSLCSAIYTESQHQCPIRPLIFLIQRRCATVFARIQWQCLPLLNWIN